MLLLTSMVSVSSMVGFSIAVIVSFYYHDMVLTVVAVALTIFVFYRHRANISRIIHGTESTVPFGLYHYLHKKK